MWVMISLGERVGVRGKRTPEVPRLPPSCLRTNRRAPSDNLGNRPSRYAEAVAEGERLVDKAHRLSQI